MTKSQTIHDMLPSQKPRERLMNTGTSGLSDAELIAIILRSGGNEISSLGLSNDLLSKFNGLRQLLSARWEELLSVKNMGQAKAASIKAVYELSLRMNGPGSDVKVKVTGPSQVFELLRRDVFEHDREHLYVLTLDSRNRLISKELISIGTVNETLIHPREIFREAIIKNATYIILAHNHPSGDTTPSDDDVESSKKINECGKLLGIPLLDHVVVSSDTYSSMKALNLLEIK